MVLLMVESETAGAARELPIPAEAMGLLTIALFGALLLVTFAFRSVAHRH